MWVSRYWIPASSDGTVEERETQPQAEGCLQYRATPLGHGPESSRTGVCGALTAQVLARKHHGESPLVARVTGTYVTPRSGCRPSARMNRKTRVLHHHEEEQGHRRHEGRNEAEGRRIRERSDEEACQDRARSLSAVPDGAEHRHLRTLTTGLNEVRPQSRRRRCDDGHPQTKERGCRQEEPERRDRRDRRQRDGTQEKTDHDHRLAAEPIAEASGERLGEHGGGPMGRPPERDLGIGSAQPPCAPGEESPERPATQVPTRV